jgi:hypothetical protein
MPRITCRQPSTGKPLNIRAENVGSSFVTIAEAPDFSVPDPSGTGYTVRDPLDATRGIAPGEVFFLTPLMARNLTASARWIEVRLLTEGGTENDAIGRVAVPAGETVAIPVQGRSLVKRNAAGANGDRLQVRADAADAFDVWASADERASAEHVGVV